MALSLCDGERESFRTLLWKLLEAHDAEIAALKQRVENVQKERDLDATTRQDLDANIPSLNLENTSESSRGARYNEEFQQGAVVVDSQCENGPGEHEEVMLRQKSSHVSTGTWTSQKLGKGASKVISNSSSDGDSVLSEDEFQPNKELLHYTCYDVLCYWIDTWISRRRAQFYALAMLILASVFLFGMVWTIIFHSAELNWYENLLNGFWIAWTYMADPGTHSEVADKGDAKGASVIENQPERILSAIIAASGIVFMGATLGMIVDIIREKMEALRQGKSSVVEKHHSLILGWTEKAVSIIEELCHANESDGGGTIVVLSQKPKEALEVDFAMQLRVGDRKGTRVVFRTGNPMVITDLMKVGAPTARATIILSNDGDPDNSDAETLRVLIALQALPHKLEGHVVAEIRDIDNEPLVKMVGGDEVESLVAHDILGRLMLTSARQPGLAKVYESLLGFQGDEFYMSEWPELVGVTFGSMIERFPDAIPIGIFTTDNELILNPWPDRQMSEGESILVIAEDDNTYKPENPVQFEAGCIPPTKDKKSMPEKILFCGWRRDIRDIVQHLDDTLQAGSEIHMITGYIPLDKRDDVLRDDGLDVDGLKNTTLVQHYGNPSVRRRLQALPLSEFNSCMIFADQAFETDTMQADSHSLATLLLLRDLQLDKGKAKGQLLEQSRLTSRVGAKGSHGLTVSRSKSLATSLEQVVKSCPVICEVLDPRTQKTITQNPYLKQSSDFCQTNKITAQLIAMVAENRSVNVLFDELLGVEGNGVNVVPSNRYTDDKEKVSFWTLAKRASTMHETLIGYKEKKGDKVSLNPHEKEKRITWGDNDLIIISQMGENTPASREHLKALPPKAKQIDIRMFEDMVKRMGRADCARVVEAMCQVLRKSVQVDARDAAGRKLNDVVV